MATVTLLEAQPLAAAGTATTTVRLAGGGRRSYAGYRGFADWRAGIVATPRFTTALGFDQNGWTAGAIPQATAISFGSADISLVSSLAQLFWTKAPVTIWTGDDEAGPPQTWTTRMVGTVADVSVDGGILTLTISDLSGNLAKPVAAGTFAGTGGIEGGDDASGRIKRRSWGRVFNIEGRVLDKANNIYEFGDPAHSLQSFDLLKDRGRAGPTTILVWQGSEIATFAALQAAACPAGGGVVAPSIACAKWWTQPSAPLTADLRGEIGLAYVETGPEVAQAIAASVSAVPVANLAAAVALRPAVAGIHCETASETAGNLLDRLLLNESLLWALQPTGEIAIREWTWDNPVETLSSDSVSRETVFSPTHSRKLGFQHNERIQSDSEISAVLLASTDVTYVDGTPIEALKPAQAGATAGAPAGTLVAGVDAATLVGQAATAKSEADTALSQLTTIASDNILSKGEKGDVIGDWGAIAAEQPGIEAQAGILGVGHSDYNAKFTALAVYLNSLGPVPGDWSNTATDTAISGATFRQKFVDYYTAKMSLLNAMAQAAIDAGPAPNELCLSDFSQGQRGFSPAATFGGVVSGSPAGGAHNVQVLMDYPGYGGDGSAVFNGVRHTISGYVSGRVLNTEYLDLFGSKSPWGGGIMTHSTMAQSAPYMMKVKNGDRVYARCSLAQHRVDMQFWAMLWDSNGNLTGALWWGGARDMGGQNGDPANMNVVGGIFNISDVTPAQGPIAYMSLMFRMIGRYGNPGVTDDSAVTGGQEGYFFATELAMGHVAQGRNKLPPYVNGPGDPVADKTSENTALDTSKLAGRDASEITGLVDAANSLAHTANSIATAVQSFTNDVADNNHASPDEKKRYVALIGQWSIDIPNEINQLAGFGLTVQASALNAAWTDFYNYLIYTVNINDVSHTTYFDRGTFYGKSNLFQQRQTEAANALQARANVITQDTSANVFIDPLFRRIADTTVWVSWDTTYANAEDSIDGRRMFCQPGAPGDVNLYSSPFVFLPRDRLDVEFEYYVPGVVNNGVLFGINLDGRDGYGAGIAGIPGVILSTSNVPRDSWQKFAGSAYGSLGPSTLSGLLPHLVFQPHSGAAIYMRNIKGYRVANASVNLDANGRQLSPLLTTSFAIAASVSVTGLSISSSDTVISLSSFSINFGGGFVGIHAMGYGGLAPSTTYHIWLIAPNMNDAGSSIVVSTNFAADPGPNAIYVGYAATQAAGGGTTTPPDSGGGGTDPGLCVTDEMWLLDGRRAGDACAGDPIDLLALDHASVERSSIAALRRGTQECVRLTTVSGIQVDCSVSTPMERQDGSMFKAPDSLGELLFVDDQGDWRWERCVGVEPIGPRPVSLISVGGRVYLAGQVPDRRIATHNIRFDPKA